MPTHLTIVNQPYPVKVRGSAKAEDASDAGRNTDCEHYRECLNSAVKQSWPSFSCHECGAYVSEKLVSNGDRLNVDWL